MAATTARCPAGGPGTPVVVVLHPGELVDADAPPLPHEPHDQPVDAVVTADGVTDLGLSPWRRTPSGRRVSTSGSVSRTAASVNGHGR